jgi:hypothetical protein
MGLPLHSTDAAGGCLIAIDQWSVRKVANPIQKAVMAATNRADSV